MKNLVTLGALLLLISTASFTLPVALSPGAILRTTGTLSNFRVHRMHNSAALAWPSVSPGYRVTAVLADGTTESSGPAAVRIVKRG